LWYATAVADLLTAIVSIARVTDSLNLLVVVGTNTIRGLDLLLAAASGTALGNGDGSSNFESLNAVTCALSGLTLALLGPGVVDTASTGVCVWISHGICSLVGSGTSMTEVQLSVIWSLAVSLLLGLLVAKDITEFEVLDGLISWKAVGGGGLVTSSLFVAIITAISTAIITAITSVTSLWGWGFAVVASLWGWRSVVVVFW